MTEAEQNEYSALDIETYLPELPAVCLAVEKTVDDPESSFEDIANVVSGDSELSQRLLRLANSPFYSYPVEIHSIPDALSVIGLRNIRSLSIALALPRLLTLPSDIGLSSNAFWKRSIAVGLCTRIMALECREANTERHFLGGYFHLVGRILIARARPEQFKKLLAKSNASPGRLHTSITKELALDECLLAHRALQHWRFSENIAALARYYRKPVLARVHPRGVSLCHIAEFFASALNLGYAGDPFVSEFSEAAWGYAAFEEAKIQRVADELTRQVDAVCSVFLDPIDELPLAPA